MVVRRQLAVVRFLGHGIRVKGAAYGMGVAILLGESIVPANSPVPIYGEAWLARILREVPAGGVKITGVAGVVVTESILLWGVKMTTAGGFGAASSLVWTWWALFTQGIRACY